MHQFAPFTGVIVLPDRAPFGVASPVTLGAGQPIASIRWHNWSMRARFEILDPSETTTLATGARAGFWSRRYQVLGPASELLLELKLGLWGTAGRGTVTLADGQILTTAGNWTSRNFSIADQVGAPVAHLVNTSRLSRCVPTASPSSCGHRCCPSCRPSASPSACAAVAAQRSGAAAST
jgi:hypothetical protein